MAAITAIIAQPTKGVLKRSLVWEGGIKAKARRSAAHMRAHKAGNKGPCRRWAKDGQQAQYYQQKDELADAAPFAEAEKGNQQNRENKVKLLFQR